MKIKTALEARKHIEKTKIIEALKSYNIYSCGHVFLNCDDPKKIKTQNNKSYRACPECYGTFVIKYKQCVCGDEIIRSNMKDGHCHACAYQNWNIKQKSYQERSALVKKEVFARGMMGKHKKASAERYDCGLRGKCLDKTLLKDPLAETLPCHECEKYFPAKGKIHSRSLFLDGMVEAA